MIGIINYGEYKINKNNKLFEITKIISQPSNVYRKFQIVDGWQYYQLNNLSHDLFKKNININYNEILADTYNYRKYDSIENIIKLMKENKKIFFDKHLNNEIFKKYSINEIMIIASLIEKEGIDYEDKKIISSVIFNRLENNMKLQIDATTIYGITKGNFKFNRKLTFEDLKIQDNYNTYYIKGLPPTPICYVSNKAVKIVLENYKSDYFFYFYDDNLNKHIYSRNFKEHKRKLSEYRKNE